MRELTFAFGAHVMRLFRRPSRNDYDDDDERDDPSGLPHQADQAEDT